MEKISIESKSHVSVKTLNVKLQNPDLTVLLPLGLSTEWQVWERER